MREAQDIEDILNGYPIKEGKILYVRVTCPCCGRRYFLMPLSMLITCILSKQTANETDTMHAR